MIVNLNGYLSNSFFLSYPFMILGLVFFLLSNEDESFWTLSLYAGIIYS